MSILDDATDILSTNDLYDYMIDRWRLWGTAVDGDIEFLKLVIKQHERESLENFKLRLDEGEVFNYSETIVNIFNFFLTQVQPHRSFDPMEDDMLWTYFLSDVDLMGTNYDVYWHNASKLASVYGYVGILVDKPQGKIGIEVATVGDEIRNAIYPYFALFTPENILDWKWEKDPVTARPELTFLKLRESSNSVLVWTKTQWERWTETDNTWQKLEEGENQLGIIPFVWYANYTDLKNPKMGVSDINNVARIQASVTRDLSNGGEVIKYAAFPMMRKPKTIVRPTDEGDVTGPTSILEFDPDNPNAKPDWLEAKVKEPIDAIMNWLDKKEEEVYRVSHLSSIHGQKSQQAKSGIALRYEFQQLSSVLSAKSKGLDEAEANAVYYWMKWQGIENRYTDIKITRPNAFNIDDLSMQLDNILASANIVKSLTYDKVLQKKVVRLVTPEENEETISTIDSEIDAYDPFANVLNITEDEDVVDE